ncbi:MAG: ATP-binding protein [bacterium]
MYNNIDYKKYPVLYIDDEEDAVDSLTAIFENEIDISGTTDPEQAITMLNEKEYAVVISDQRMPVMEGVVLLARIKKMFPKVVSVLLTAYADLDAAIKSINEVGIYRYIPKTASPEETILLVKQAIQYYHIQQELERMQEELIRSERLKAVGILAAGMAHEIKNPLTGIKTFIEYLPSKHNDKEFINKFTRIVNPEIEKINTLVRQLLDFAKPKPIELKECDLPKLLDETLDLLFDIIMENKIEVIRNYTTSPIIKADSMQIKQVFCNLIMNAVDAMKERENRKLTVAIKQNNHLYIEISIEDTGSGISQENLEHLFDVFFSTKDMGTGLGLSIVHGIIEKHKGLIEVESKENVGTTFRIKLPKRGAAN